jgi:hypothetical protein
MLVLVIVVAAGLVRALYLSYKLTRYLARSALEQCKCRLRTRVAWHTEGALLAIIPAADATGGVRERALQL